MYIKRKVDDILLEWKRSSNKKTLVLQGPPFIGKRTSARNFAQKHYSTFVEIDLRYQSCEAVYCPKDALIILLHPECSPTWFENLNIENDILCCDDVGSIDRDTAHVTVLPMRTMDFEEFLLAKGYDQSVIDSISEHLIELRPFSTVELTTFNRLFFDFCVLGGFPEIVSLYLKNDTFEGTLALQRTYLKALADLNLPLTHRDKTRVRNLVDQIGSQLNKKNKKFQITKLTHGARLSDYQPAIASLENAGIINRCSCMNTPELPIRGNVNPEKFKLYFHDTGLLVASLDQEAQEDLRFNKNLGIYKGALYENFVGTALVAQGYDLCYYKKENSTLEEDFFVRTTDSLVPVEVKAGNTKSKSLNTLVNGKGYEDIRFGLKLCAGNIGFENNIYTLPYFCAFVLRKWLKTL